MRPNTRFSNLAVAALLAALSPVVTSSLAADWPQYHGPTGDKHTPDKISKTWPAEGPKTLWKAPLNAGFSSLTVSGGRAFTMVTRAVEGVDQEVVVAMDATTGKEQWAFPLGVARYQGGGDSGAADNKGGDGPRSTPTVIANRVFAYSSKMLLVCLDADSGKQVWSVNVLKDHAGRNISWDSAASPLVEGNLVFVAGGGAGQALLAFDQQTGKVAWSGQDDQMTHSTPIAATIHGVR